MKNKVFLVLVLLSAILLSGKVGYDRYRQRSLDQAIMDAVFRSDFTEVLRLVEQGANPNGPPFYRDREYWRHDYQENGRSIGGFTTPAELAGQAGRADVVRKLLESGVDLKRTNRLGEVLLIQAAQHGDEALFSYLLQRGIDPNETTVGGFDFNILMHLVHIRAFDEAWKGDSQALALLALQHGANPNQRGMHGFTPLRYAVSYEQTDLVHLFLEYGADPAIPDLKGMDSMGMAWQRSNRVMIQLLLRSGGKFTPPQAVLANHLEGLREALAKDPSAVRKVYHEGNSLLGLALKQRDEPISHLLIEAGADLTVLNDAGESLLHCAAAGGKEELISLLLEKGLAVNARDKSLDTPLHKTMAMDRPRAAAVLVAAGADLDARNALHWTPLRHALHRRAPEVLGVMLQGGGAPNQMEPHDGMRLLGVVCQDANIQEVFPLIRVLHSYDADLNLRDAHGRTVLHWAAARHRFDTTAKHDSLVRFLLDRGADPSLRDNSGKNALEIAIESDGNHSSLKVQAIRSAMEEKAATATVVPASR